MDVEDGRDVAPHSRTHRNSGEKRVLGEEGARNTPASPATKDALLHWVAPQGSRSCACDLPPTKNLRMLKQ